jgi:ATP-dependent DNA helicase DinG
MSTMIRGKRAVNELDNLIRDVGAVREHFVGTARWLQPMKPQTHTERLAKGREWSKAQAAPVAVGRMIERNVWNEVTKATEDEDEVVRPLTVACLSATLPAGFNRDVGLSLAAPPRHYESPFDLAYGNSMLYVPRAVDADDVNALGSYTYGKMKFDTKKHAEWAAGYMLPLVDANLGSALVLSATVGSGKLYAQRLRAAARGRWNVYSQWDGENVRVITQRWRDDPSGVMVGTKSLMTGVDAPGETCSLVIVDRAPRSAGNPVDDARVEMISESFGGDKWAADALVYVSDATLLLEQALGRLIRSTSDSGMAAILDPRMLKAGPFKYPDRTRNAYQTAMTRFPNKTTSIDDAVAYLKNRQANLRSKR